MSATQLQFGGEELFHVSPERLFEAVTDLDLLAKTIPDIQSSERVDESTLKAVVRPGFSFLRGTLQTTIKLVEADAPRSAVLQIASQGIGAQITVESRLTIEPDAEGSRLAWTATVTQIRGLVATVSRPLISAAATQVIAQGWQHLRTSLEGEVEKG
jgi:carbon monoxide dehydrogenase subunit G